MAKTLPAPAGPPTPEQLIEVWRRVVPREYSEPFLNGGNAPGDAHPSFALIRSMAYQWAQVAAKANRSIQARYHLPSAIQTDLPASSARAAGIAQGDVVLRRVGDRSDALVIDPGRMRLAADGGRFYVNRDRVVWNPGDTNDRTVRFVCEVVGFIGNLDHLANPEGGLDVDLISIVDQAGGRAAGEGSILLLSQSVLQDSGIPDLFNPADVGLHVRIDTAATPSNVGRFMRIVGFDWPELEIPLGSGRFPRRVFLEDERRVNTVEALQDDGGVFTDYDIQARNENGIGDVPLLPAVPAVGDAFYFGFTEFTTGVEIRLDTPGVGDWTIVWEYWDGLAWQPLPDIDDPTEGFKPTAGAGTYDVRWTIPLGWQSLLSPAGSGLNLFYARARVDAFVAVTDPPAAGRVVMYNPQPLTAEAADPVTGTVKWTLLDYTAAGVGLEIVEAEPFTGGRDDDLFILGDQRGLYQQNGESDDVFRDRVSRLADVVSPNAILRAVNRVLRPLGFRGDVCDVTIGDTVGAGFTGLFFDLDPALAPEIVAAFDMYAAGDLFPKDPWLVLQSAQEAYGWFLVKAPYLGEGDFGIFLDEGPLFFDETVQVYYGPSAFGFMDGFPIDGYATYAAIYSAVDAIRAGGVGFTLLRREDLTVPGAC